MALVILSDGTVSELTLLMIGCVMLNKENSARNLFEHCLYYVKFLILFQISLLLFIRGSSCIFLAFLIVYVVYFS
jgi:hypothetical protein